MRWGGIKWDQIWGYFEPKWYPTFKQSSSPPVHPRMKSLSFVNSAILPFSTNDSSIMQSRPHLPCFDGWMPAFSCVATDPGCLGASMCQPSTWHQWDVWCTGCTMPSQAHHHQFTHRTRQLTGLHCFRPKIAGASGKPVFHTWHTFHYKCSSTRNLSNF